MIRRVGDRFVETDQLQVPDIPATPAAKTTSAAGTASTGDPNEAEIRQLESALAKIQARLAQLRPAKSSAAQPTQSTTKPADVTPSTLSPEAYDAMPAPKMVIKDGKLVYQEATTPASTAPTAANAPVDLSKVNPDEYGKKRFSYRIDGVDYELRETMDGSKSMVFKLEEDTIPDEKGQYGPPKLVPTDMPDPTKVPVDIPHLNVHKAYRWPLYMRTYTMSGYSQNLYDKDGYMYVTKPNEQGKVELYRVGEKGTEKTLTPMGEFVEGAQGPLDKMSPEQQFTTSSGKTLYASIQPASDMTPSATPAQTQKPKAKVVRRRTAPTTSSPQTTSTPTVSKPQSTENMTPEHIAAEKERLTQALMPTHRQPEADKDKGTIQAIKGLPSRPSAPSQTTKAEVSPAEASIQRRLTNLRNALNNQTQAPVIANYKKKIQEAEQELKNIQAQR